MNVPVFGVPKNGSWQDISLPVDTGIFYSGEAISSDIQGAVYRFILDQAVDAMKNLACSDTLADALFRDDYNDDVDD